jgi:uncharacterized protein (TIGR02996 family)
MPTKESFLQSIIEAPDDDTPRLVYADWLDDHDDPAWAEFIRVQCTLAKMGVDDPQRPALQQRERELLQEHGWTWALDLGPQVSAWVYRRGFIEGVEMCLEASRDEILPVLQKAPIRHIRDTSQFCHFDGIVDALPGLHHLTGLEFWGLYAFQDALLDQILASPHLGNLRTLILYHDRNGNLAKEDVIVRALHSPHRANLQDLAVNIDDQWRGPSRKILSAIATSRHLRNLRKLNLSNAGDQGNRPEMDVDTIRALGQSPNLAGLEELDLGRTSFPIEAWDEVLRWPWLSRLKWLRLHYARHVNPPHMLTVNEIQNLPQYRQAFEQLVATVDWSTQFIGPWDGRSSWQGLSWDGLRQQHLFSMWPYVQKRAYDGLEAAFRADCLKHAGQAATEAIESVPFHSYQAKLAAGLREAIAASSRHPGANSIFLRIRTDLRWGGNFHVSNASIPEPFEPHAEYSHSGPLADLKAPDFPEAAQVRDQFQARGLLDPGGAVHYLLARTVAALGRCVAQQEVPVPVFFSCMSAVFRM